MSIPRNPHQTLSNHLTALCTFEVNFKCSADSVAKNPREEDLHECDPELCPLPIGSITRNKIIGLPQTQPDAPVSLQFRSKMTSNPNRSKYLLLAIALGAILILTMISDKYGLMCQKCT